MCPDLCAAGIRLAEVRGIPLAQRSKAGIEAAIDLFEEAVKKDPDFAPAYADLANAYNLQAFYGFNNAGYSVPKANAAAYKALVLDESLAAAHAALAYTNYQFVWDWKEAETEFQRAIALDGNYAPAHHWYALFLAAMGRRQESIERIRRAQQLDPRSAIVRTGAAYVHYLAHDNDEAENLCRQVLGESPDFLVAHNVLGWALIEKGIYPEAIAELRRSYDLSGKSPDYLAHLGRAYGRAGDRRAAEGVLQQLEAAAKDVKGYYTARALVLIGMGENDQAITALLNAEEHNETHLLWVNAAPEYDPVRSDPRVQQILRRARFPKMGIP